MDRRSGHRARRHHQPNVGGAILARRQSHRETVSCLRFEQLESDRSQLEKCSFAESVTIRLPNCIFPQLQQSGGLMTLMARTQPQQASTVVDSMRQAVRELDADLPTFGPPSLSARIARRVSQWRLLNFLLSTFGVLALTLASVGLYGVLSHSVARRTREIAVRLAMGAKRDHTVWLILRQALVLVAIGLAIGIAMALAGIRMLRNFVAELGPAIP